jgi:hypothetical protein
MGFQLPPPAQTRAIIIGIEDYPGMGSEHSVPGAVTAAVNFARWFVNRGGSASQIEIWLAPGRETEARELCKQAKLDNASICYFNEHNFVQALDKPHPPMIDGKFLIVYWCGHGMVSGDVSSHYLVLPEAEPHQMRCISLQNWQRLFQSSNWQKFSHQLWIIDACRNDWGSKFRPNVQRWNIQKPAKVSRCTICACSVGETTTATSDQGPLFSHRLLDALSETDERDIWPNFVQIAQTLAASSLIENGLSRQPVLVLEHWDGTLMTGQGLTGPTPEQMLGEIPWPTGDFLKHLNATLGCAPASGSKPDLRSIDDIVSYLFTLPQADNVSPLYDYLERVARASGSVDLKLWLAARLTAAQRQELNKRLSEDEVQARLSLWYQTDDTGHSIAADLQILNAACGIQPWSSGGARSVQDRTVHTILGDWMRELNERVGTRKLKLEIELCMPLELLSSTQLDIATVPLTEDDEVRFGEDHPVLLRSTDRYKAVGKRRRFEKIAPPIFARLGSNAHMPVRWTHSNTEKPLWKAEFTADTLGAPVWLGFDVQRTGCTPLEQAVTEGLPAVLWFRESETIADFGQLQASLEKLLHTTLDKLPEALSAWRNQSLATAKPALLLDDPGRAPPMWSDWNQPGE